MGDKSRDRLNKIIENRVTEMFGSILDDAQIACPQKDTFKILRARILRAGNDCIRDIKKQTANFDVEYNRLSEEVINCGNSKCN